MELQGADEVARDALVGDRRPRARERRERRRTPPPAVRRQPAARAAAPQPRQRARAVRAQALARPGDRRAAREAPGRRQRREQFETRSGVTLRIVARLRATDQHAIVTILRSVRAESARGRGAGRCGVELRADRARRARSRTPRSTSWRWRISRREGGARAAPVGGRLALWLTGVALLFVALISPVDRLGEQLATMHMVQHLLLADLVPICLTLALTKHILRPATRRDPPDRAGGRAVRASRVRRRRLRRRDVGLAHPGALRRRARARVRPRARAPELRRGRPAVLVAPAVADPLAAAARRPRPGALHGVDEDPRRLPRHPARVLPRGPLRRLRDRRGRAGGCPRSTTSTSPAS